MVRNNKNYQSVNRKVIYMSLASVSLISGIVLYSLAAKDKTPTAYEAKSKESDYVSEDVSSVYVPEVPVVSRRTNAAQKAKIGVKAHDEYVHMDTNEKKKRKDIFATLKLTEEPYTHKKDKKKEDDTILESDKSEIKREISEIVDEKREKKDTLEHEVSAIMPERSETHDSSSSLSESEHSTVHTSIEEPIRRTILDTNEVVYEHDKLTETKEGIMSIEDDSESGSVVSLSEASRTSHTPETHEPMHISADTDDMHIHKESMRTEALSEEAHDTPHTYTETLSEEAHDTPHTEALSEEAHDTPHTEALSEEAHDTPAYTERVLSETPHTIYMPTATPTVHTLSEAPSVSGAHTAHHTEIPHIHESTDIAHTEAKTTGDTAASMHELSEGDKTKEAQIIDSESDSASEDSHDDEDSNVSESGTLRKSEIIRKLDAATAHWLLRARHTLDLHRMIDELPLFEHVHRLNNLLAPIDTRSSKKFVRAFIELSNDPTNALGELRELLYERAKVDDIDDKLRSTIHRLHFISFVSHKDDTTLSNILHQNSMLSMSMYRKVMASIPKTTVKSLKSLRTNDNELDWLLDASFDDITTQDWAPSAQKRFRFLNDDDVTKQKYAPFERLEKAFVYAAYTMFQHKTGKAKVKLNTNCVTALHNILFDILTDCKTIFTQSMDVLLKIIAYKSKELIPNIQEEPDPLNLYAELSDALQSDCADCICSTMTTLMYMQYIYHALFQPALNSPFNYLLEKDTRDLAVMNAAQDNIIDVFTLLYNQSISQGEVTLMQQLLFPMGIKYLGEDRRIVKVLKYLMFIYPLQREIPVGCVETSGIFVDPTNIIGIEASLTKIMSLLRFTKLYIQKHELKLYDKDDEIYISTVKKHILDILARHNGTSRLGSKVMNILLLSYCINPRLMTFLDNLGIDIDKVSRGVF